MTGVVQQTKEPLNFEVIIVQAPPPGSKVSTKRGGVKDLKVKEKKDFEGIHFLRFGRFPTCIFCKLEDHGKDAIDRPTKKHMINCPARKLTPKPYTELNGVRTERLGQYHGEIQATTIRIPVRLIRKITTPVLDDKGNPTGQTTEFFATSYKWQSVEAWDWAWTGKEWVPFYAFNPEKFVDPKVAPEPTESERRWLACFAKK